jgi:DNA transformation protein and related proteins
VGVSPEYRDWVIEQLREAGPVTGRSMFGGYGIYLDGAIFGIIASDVLYFKVDDSNRPDFEAAGMQPFRPFKDSSEVMQYYEVPADVLEDRERAAEWARRAAAISRRSAAKKRRGKQGP